MSQPVGDGGPVVVVQGLKASAARTPIRSKAFTKAAWVSEAATNLRTCLQRFRSLPKRHDADPRQPGTSNLPSPTTKTAGQGLSFGAGPPCFVIALCALLHTRAAPGNRGPLPPCICSGHVAPFPAMGSPDYEWASIRPRRCGMVA